MRVWRTRPRRLLPKRAGKEFDVSNIALRRTASWIFFDPEDGYRSTSPALRRNEYHRHIVAVHDLPCSRSDKEVRQGVIGPQQDAGRPARTQQLLPTALDAHGVYI